MADRPATPSGSLTATGYTLFNAQIGLRWKSIEVGADVLNIGNVVWREGQLAVDLAAPGRRAEPAHRDEHDARIPREVIAHAVVYW